MAQVYWVGPNGSGDQLESGDFTAGSNWSNGAVPDSTTDVYLQAGTYTVTCAASATVNSLTIGAGATFDLAGVGTTAYFFDVNANSFNDGVFEITGSLVTLGGTLLNTGEILGFLTSYLPEIDGGSIENAGRISVNDGNYLLLTSTVNNDARGVVASNGGYVELGGTVTNNGLIEANGGTLTFTGFGATGSTTNLVNDVLTGGSWLASGEGAMTLVGTAIYTLGAGTIVTLDDNGSEISVVDGNGGAPVTIEASLSTVEQGATLNILDGRDYSTGNSLEVDGTLLLQGGTLTPFTLISDGGGLVEGYGAITSNGSFAGEVQADQNAANPGQSLDFSGSVNFYGTVTGNGTIELSGGSDLLAAGRISVANLLLDGADVQLGSNEAYGHHLSLSAGTLDLQDDRLALTGKTLFSGGVIQGEGDGLLYLKGGEMISAGDTEVDVAWQNAGAVTVRSGTLLVDAKVFGTGSFVVNGTSNLEFGSAAQVAHGQTVTLADKAELLLDTPQAFDATIAGFAGKERIDLTTFSSKGVSWSWHEDRQGTGGTLRITDAGGTVSLSLTGTYHKSDFALAGDNHGGTLIRYVGAGPAATLPAHAFGADVHEPLLHTSLAAQDLLHVHAAIA